MKRPFSPVLVLLSMTAAACGQSRAAPATSRSLPPAAAAPAPASTAPASTAPAVDACSAVSRTDVESIFGALRSDPKASEGLSHERECRYQNLENQWLTISLYGSDRWELQRGITSEQHPTPVALGDEAFAVKLGTDSVMYVRKGGSVIEVSCSCGMEKTQRLAERAVRKF